MTEQEQYQEQLRRQSADSSGIKIRSRYVTSVQQRAIRHDAEILALPVDTSVAPHSLQKSDGTFVFMVDYSMVGGPDPVA